MRDAFSALMALGPDGLQLTPGNQPSVGFEAVIKNVRCRTHHGFSLTQWKTTVWADDGSCTVSSDSVHPPMSSHPAAKSFVERGALPVLETMYPGYCFGSGVELEQAMRQQLRLAVDISHVFLQKAAGVITDATWARLQDYEHIAEVHVSRNDGRSDQHQPLTAETFGLEWALEKLSAGTPVILESYFHRLSLDARRAQCALFDNARS